MLRKTVLAALLAQAACQTDEVGESTQALSGNARSPIVNTTPNAALLNSDYLSVPGGQVMGPVVTRAATTTGVGTLTDSGAGMTTDQYKGRHLTDALGYSWTILSNTSTTFTLNVAAKGFPTYTPPVGTYRVSGQGIYVGPTLPTAAQTSDGDYIGGICTSEVGNTCPTGYVKADHAQFGLGDGNDMDLNVKGCTNLEQLRLVSPYRPATCNDCGTGTNGCTVGADCPWSTITQVNGYGAPDDFLPMVQTSNLHIKPALAGGVLQEWTGINDGADTGRVLVFTNDSDMSGGTPTTIDFRHENAASIRPGDRFKFPGGLDHWLLEPGSVSFFLHDDGVGPDRMRLVATSSTRVPRSKPWRLDTETALGVTTVVAGTCGGAATITKGSFSFTVTPSAATASCQMNFPTGLFTVRPMCQVSFDTNVAYNKSVSATSITVSASGGVFLNGPFDVTCTGREN